MKVQNDEGTSKYLYKADGLRLSKDVNGEIVTHVWDGQNIVMEYGAVNDVYLRGINLIKSNQQGYYLFNAHGDVVQRTSDSGVLIKSYVYDAFGVERNIDTLDTNPFRYCAEYFDSSSGTYYLRQRVYQPNTGRFLTEDSHWNVSNMIYGDNPQRINERQDALGLTIYTYQPDLTAIKQSGNLYIYCINNPVLYTDPTGNLVWPGEIHDAVQIHIMNNIALEYLFNGGEFVWVEMNKFIRYDFLSYGFADLYDPKVGEVWEVKPNKNKYVVSGKAQLQKYIDHIPDSKAGRNLGNGSFYHVNNGTLTPLPGVYEVFYYSNSDDGMIYYDYNKVVDTEEIAAIVAAIAAAIYSGQPLPTPSFG